MKMLRIFGIAFGSLAALLIVGIAVLYAMFDAPAIKSEMIRQVAARTGRTLAIDGELALSVWPDVAIRLGRVTLSEMDGKTRFAGLDSVRLAVAVLPLLDKRLEARHIEVDGLSLSLLKRRDGSLNINDLAGDGKKLAEIEAEQARPSASEPLRIEVAGITLRNARLIWNDEATGKVTELSNLQFTSGRLLGDVDKKQFEVEKLALSTSGKMGDEIFDLTLAVPGLTLAGDAVAGKSLDLLAKLRGEKRQIETRLALKGIAGSPAHWQLDQFSVDLAATLGATVLNAKIASPLTFDAAGRALVLAKLAGGLELASPALPMKHLKLPLTGHFEADLSKQTAHLALDTRLDDSTIALKLAVDQLSPLILGFGIDIDRLDIDRYLPPATASNPASKDASKGASTNQPGPNATVDAGGDKKIDLAALNTLNLHGSVKIGQLQVHHLKLSQLDARISVLDGQLQVAPLSAALYGGTLDGSLAVTAANSRFEVKQKLVGISIQPLLKDLLGQDPLEGRGSVALDLVMQGQTLSALKKGLAGQAALDLKDGAVKGVNVAKLLREVKAGLSEQPGTIAASTVEKTDFSTLTATFRIAGGVAHNDDLLLKSPFLRLGGAGDIDIGNERIDYLAKVSVVNTATGQEGKSLANLKGITLPLRMQGPFSQLAFSLELESLIKDLARAQLDERKEELKAKAVEKLGDKLKGLFGR